MDTDTGERLARIEAALAELGSKADAAYQSAEKTRKYILWTGIVTAAVIIVPLLILPLVIPSFLASVTIPSGF